MLVMTSNNDPNRYLRLWKIVTAQVLLQLYIDRS